jgi:hypothetical protein
MKSAPTSNRRTTQAKSNVKSKPQMDADEHDLL